MNLLQSLPEYLNEHPALIAVVAVIGVIILALLVLLIVTEVKKRKKRASPEPEESKPETDSREPVDETREPEAEQEPEIQEKPKEAQEQPEEKKEEQPLEEQAPAASVAPSAPKKAERSETASNVPAPSPGKKKEGAIGKWVIYEEERGGFGFKLLASNGEVMLKSSSPYASPTSAKSGIKTYQDNIAANRLSIVETKSGSFFVQINNGSNRLLATSADYKTRSSCESAADSIRRWAASTVITMENDDKA